jgi:carboxyl-terminal processing protease
MRRTWTWSLCLAVLLASAVGIAQARCATDDLPFGQPSGLERNVARLVDDLLKQHLSHRQLNDEISRRALDLYLKNLDGMKMYFMQSDIDEFQQFADSLDDRLPRGDYEVAFFVFERFLQRLDERVAVAHELIDIPHDFTIDEEMVIDRDQLAYAQTDDEMRERWRKRIKYELLVRRAEDRDRAAQAEREGEEGASPRPIEGDPPTRLHKRYRAFANRMHQFDNEDVIELYISSITTSFDPHTAYMSRSSYESFLINLRLQLEGIGATLRPSDDGYTVIHRIVAGGAADKHGKLKVDDRIIAVGQGESGEMVDTTDMNIDDVVDMIRGKAGTTVRLRVLSGLTNEITEYSIVRERVELKDEEARGVVFEHGTKPDGTPYRFGFIDLPSFYASDDDGGAFSSRSKSVTRDVRRVLEGFNEQHVDAVIIDLRKNGGGSLKEAVDLTGLFIDRGPVVQVKDMYGQIEELDDTARGMVWSGPLVVLTSKFSASASEILAGAVQDYGRGLVVGDSSTHGKGTVQTLLNLTELVLRTRDAPNKMGALKITIQQFYRPNGDSTQQRGVLADVTLPSLTDHMDVSEADLDYPLDFDRIREADFQAVGMVNGALVEKLQQRSAQRVDSSSEFQREEERIRHYVEQKSRKVVTLNEEKFFQNRAQLDKEQEDERALEDQMNHTNKDIERDYYVDEVLSIAQDLLQSLQGGPLAQNQ